MSCGYDAGKKIKGRKRHLLTDTNGLMLGVVVTPASVISWPGSANASRHPANYGYSPDRL